jgi:hypothetical protein
VQSSHLLQPLWCIDPLARARMEGEDRTLAKLVLPGLDNSVRRTRNRIGYLIALCLGLDTACCDKGGGVAAPASGLRSRERVLGPGRER